LSVGIIMLCHTALERAADAARHWSDHGCPVVIHVDRRVRKRAFQRLRRSLSDVSDIRFSDRYACEWGTWGLVQATQAAATRLLADFPEVQHAYLASGACLPLRPVEELVAYLAARPETDFIESVTTEDVGWTVGGLNIERFTLRFPFSWRKQRRLFDAYVRLQRRLGFARGIPAGIEPHLGSQWWCLTRQTLTAILQSPDRAAHDRYFKRVWIPDEAYFQTLVRRYSQSVESRSLTLSKFDFQGKPHVFYDDHLQLLRKSDCFVARKIWPHADKLYNHFLSADLARQPAAEPAPGKIDRIFARAVERRTAGRHGLYMQSRFPQGARETAAPYSVVEGFSELFVDFESWLGKVAGMRVHGRLFAPERAEFAGGETIYNGAMSDSAALRDYNPEAFLTNLIWNTRGERQCFQFDPRDVQRIGAHLAQDDNARIAVISGAWALRLFRSGIDLGSIRKEAARLQKIEADHLALLRRPSAKGRVRIWTLAEFAENPMDHLQTLLEDINPRSARRLTEVPRMIDLSGFAEFLATLRNQGMQPILTGDFTGLPRPAEPLPQRSRPHLVK
jgi:hypothetical protein